MPVVRLYKITLEQASLFYRYDLTGGLAYRRAEYTFILVSITLCSFLLLIENLI